MSSGGNCEPDQNNSARPTTDSQAQPATAAQLNNDSDSAAAPAESPNQTKESVVSQLTKDQGVAAELANQLAELVLSPSASFSIQDFDHRALAAVKDLQAEFLRGVVDELLAKDYTNISNKSACLCGLVKQHKLKKQQQQGDGGATGNRRGSSNYSVASSNASLGPAAASGSSAGAASGPGLAPVPVVTAKPGPDEAKLKELLAEIKFAHEVTVGQRRLGPPLDADELKDASQCEIFVGKLPKDMYEDQIYQMFRPVGPIYDVRVMVDPPTGMGRGFCFVCYTNRQDAAEAVHRFHEYEIKPQRRLQVNLATPNLRLFVGNIPKTLDRTKLLEDFSRILEGVVDVIVYGSADDPRKKNRGFCFLEFDKHSSASAARRKLMKYPRVWTSDVWVDWADPLDEPDPDTMAKVRVLYVKSLTMDLNEDKLQEVFSAYGPLERVKKVKDYGFVHFEEREDALRAMEKLNGTSIGKSGPLSVTLAKPVSERAKQRKEERRMRSVAMPVMPGPPSAAYHPQHHQPAAYQTGYYHHPQHHAVYPGMPGSPWATGGGGGYGPSIDHHNHPYGGPAAAGLDHSAHQAAAATAGSWPVTTDQQMYYAPHHQQQQQQQHMPVAPYHQPYPPPQPHHLGPMLQPQQQAAIVAGGRQPRGGSATIGLSRGYQQQQQQQQQEPPMPGGMGIPRGGRGGSRPPYSNNRGSRQSGPNIRPQQQQQQPSYQQS